MDIILLLLHGNRLNHNLFLGVADIRGTTSEVLKIRRIGTAEAGIAFFTETSTLVGVLAVGNNGELRFYDKNGTKHIISYI